MNNNNQARERERKAIRLELSIWNALIGANGLPAVQKFAIQHRLYAFSKTVVKVSNEDYMRELQQTHSVVKKGQGTKIKQFIDFIEGDMSLDEAIKIKNTLRDLLNKPVIQLASG